jgi:hypothetical protein
MNLEIYLLLLKIHESMPRSPTRLIQDNIVFGDALGRVKSLEFEYFRHWRVGACYCWYDLLLQVRIRWCSQNNRYSGNGCIANSVACLEWDSRCQLWWKDCLRRRTYVREMAVPARMIHRQIQTFVCSGKCIPYPSTINPRFPNFDLE